jgi:hypothetical protein
MSDIGGEHIYIFGHTPTASSKWLHNFTTCSAWVSSNKINIDSGCVYGGRLGALRLDDMQHFYVNSRQKGQMSKVRKSRKKRGIFV